jgi:hypothetical protein
MKIAMMMTMLLAVGLAGCAGSNSTPAASNGGATGAAPDRYMGEKANVNGTYNGSTSSSTMLMQRIKQDSANGATSGGGDTKY